MTNTAHQRASTYHATEHHIEAVARLEQQFQMERTWADWLADAIGGFSGTIQFVILHVCVFSLWFTINTGLIPGVHPFDPYPFIFLTMVVSMEGVLLATFVLMMQNRMARKTAHRDHLNLQIDLLAEREITKILQMQRAMCQHMGIEHVCEDPELIEMSEETSVESLARILHDRLESSEKSGPQRNAQSGAGAFKQCDFTA